MKKTSARILAVGLPLAVVAASGAAFAYWTSNGSGNASATAESSVAGVTLASDAISGLVPGGSVTVPVTATNPNAKTSVGVKTLTVGAVTSSVPACTLVAGATAEPTSPATEVVIAPGASAPFGSVKVTMANSEVNQDACKGATFTVALTAA